MVCAVVSNVARQQRFVPTATNNSLACFGLLYPQALLLTDGEYRR
jgi:hypothetical protein